MRPHDPKARILVVDDEPEVAGTIRAILVHEGFKVEIAENGRRALDLLMSTRHFDLVVTDIKMPEMGGLELLRQLHQLRKNLPVIAMTGEETVTNGLQAVEEGAFDYISKPFDVKVLMKIVHEALKDDY